jgi:hypothetical protein
MLEVCFASLYLAVNVIDDSLFLMVHIQAYIHCIISSPYWTLVFLVISFALFWLLICHS